MHLHPKFSFYFNFLTGTFHKLCIKENKIELTNPFVTETLYSDAVAGYLSARDSTSNNLTGVSSVYFPEETFRNIDINIKM